MESKICSKCLIEKPVSDFYHRKDKTRRIILPCKECQKQIVKKWGDENKEHRQEVHKEWLRWHPEKSAEYARTRYKKHKESILCKQRQYRKNNIGMIRERGRLAGNIYRSKNREICIMRTKRSHTKNREKYLAKKKDLYLVRKKDPAFRINQAMRSAIYQCLKHDKNYRKWHELVGYSIGTLRDHLKKRFSSGMSWDNYGKWHVDHVIPLAAFNFQTAEDIDFKRAWSLKNLRPLWAYQNYSKGARLSKPFQPCLALKV